jgi:hypothetical protein
MNNLKRKLRVTPHRKRKILPFINHRIGYARIRSHVTTRKKSWFRLKYIKSRRISLMLQLLLLRLVVTGIVYDPLVRGVSEVTP